MAGELTADEVEQLRAHQLAVAEIWAQAADRRKRLAMQRWKAAKKKAARELASITTKRAAPAT